MIHSFKESHPNCCHVSGWLMYLNPRTYNSKGLTSSRFSKTCSWNAEKKDVSAVGHIFTDAGKLHAYYPFILTSTRHSLPTTWVTEHTMNVSLHVQLHESRQKHKLHYNNEYIVWPAVGHAQETVPFEFPWLTDIINRTNNIADAKVLIVVLHSWPLNFIGF